MGQYAQQRLIARGEWEAHCARHADYALGEAEEIFRRSGESHAHAHALFVPMPPRQWQARELELGRSGGAK